MARITSTAKHSLKIEVPPTLDASVMMGTSGDKKYIHITGEGEHVDRFLSNLADISRQMEYAINEMRMRDEGLATEKES